MESMKLSHWVMLLYFLGTVHLGITISLMDFAGEGERFTAEDGVEHLTRIERIEQHLGLIEEIEQ